VCHTDAGAIAAAFRHGIDTMCRAAQLGGDRLSSLVRIHAVSTDQLAFTFDYYDNGSAAGIPALGWDVRRTLEFFGGVCRAVAALHEIGLAHRALKPSNVLVDDALKPLLTDAGMLAPAEAGQALDSADAIYRAPEELGGDALQSPSADVYSLGRLLWFLLEGSDPDEPYDAFAKLSSLERFPPGLVRIIRKATAHDPAARYQWVEELEADIARYFTPELVGIGPVAPGDDYPRHCISSLPAAVPNRAESPVAAERPTTPRVEAMASRSRSLVRAAGWAGVAAALVGLAVVFLPPALPPELAELAGSSMMLGCALATLLLRPYSQSPGLFRIAAFGVVLAALFPLELDRLVILRWKLTLAHGSEEGRAKATRLLARSGARNLSGAELAGADLARADLGRADLRNADLRRANLAGANLAEADLRRADLREADLRGATLLSSNAFEAVGFAAARCSRSTAMPSGWICADGHPTSARD
jgi:hypothetical protein